MSPRFRRYLLGSLRVLAVNWVGAATETAWLHVPPALALGVWLINVWLRWATRAEPGRRD